ncbi:MAG: hypothetical protein MUC91_03160 [Verrucomicrobia bacterium]|jgi:hypothetical protein|nr:hypothetical protein [Verrucomicrobiota bacterium]
MRTALRKRASSESPAWHLVRRGSHLVVEGLEGPLTGKPHQEEIRPVKKQVPCIFQVEKETTCPVRCTAPSGTGTPPSIRNSP